MKKIVIICPYLGKLPYNQIKIFLKSCEKNPNVDWILMIDDRTKYLWPKNVKVIYTTLDEIRKKIQEKFDFKICLDSAYKLCDFKPTYGYVFQNIIKEYDYWGHCDLSDSIFGSFEEKIGNILDKGYDKIGIFGHLTLYKNEKEVNERIFLPSNSNKDLKDILGVSNNMAFDETYNYSINQIYMDNGFKIKRIDDLYVDVSTRSSCFRRAKWSDKLEWLYLLKERYIIEWDNGRLYKIYLKDREIKKEEILYVHYQKRKMDFQIDIDNTNQFYIVPNKFITLDSIDEKVIKKYTKNKLINRTLLNIRIKKLEKILKRKLFKNKE